MSFLVFSQLEDLLAYCACYSIENISSSLFDIQWSKIETEFREIFSITSSGQY